MKISIVKIVLESILDEEKCMHQTFCSYYEINTKLMLHYYISFMRNFTLVSNGSRQAHVQSNFNIGWCRGHSVSLASAKEQSDSNAEGNLKPETDLCENPFHELVPRDLSTETPFHCLHHTSHYQRHW